ncbi:MAG: hypothetical protein ABJM26_20600 [Anderseniella sp.]
MSFLVFVDRPLSISMAVSLVGLEIENTRTSGLQGGLSWLIQTNYSEDQSSSVMRDIREMLPETLAHDIDPKIPDAHRFGSVKDCVESLANTGDGRILPGMPVKLAGVLTFPGFEEIGDYDPLSPPDIELPKFSFHGENCVLGQLEGDGFALPLYFLNDYVEQVAFCHNCPVEVTGIVRWSPGYRTRGARTLNLAIRVASLSLQ